MNTITPALEAAADPAVTDVALQERLRRMAADERAAEEAALALLAAGNRRAVLRKLRLQHAHELQNIVASSGWPTVPLVGEECATYCLQVLLVCEDLPFQTRCRDLIEKAVVSGACPAIHHAFIADKIAVAWSRPQRFGTQVNPVPTRPYPIEDSEGVDERRRAVGLAPLADVVKAYQARLRGEEPSKADHTAARRAPRIVPGALFSGGLG